MSKTINNRELLRKKRKEQQRRRVYIIFGVLLTVILIFGMAALLPKFIMSRAKYDTNPGFTIGDQNAPVTVVQFSSYACPFCRNFSENVEKDFIAQYVDTGNVFYRYVNIPSDSIDSLNGAKASFCAADQNLFFEYKDYLYTNVDLPDGFSFENLKGYARSAGLDLEQFTTCFEDPANDNIYLEDLKLARSVGVTGTPSFLVNDQLVSSNELIATVEALLTN